MVAVKIHLKLYCGKNHGSTIPDGGRYKRVKKYNSPTYRQNNPIAGGFNQARHAFAG